MSVNTSELMRSKAVWNSKFKHVDWGLDMFITHLGQIVRETRVNRESPEPLFPPSLGKKNEITEHNMYRSRYYFRNSADGHSVA